MDTEISTMVQAAQIAGRIIRRNFGSSHCLGTKSHIINLVTDTDRRAQALILKTLHNAFPTYGFLAEEDPQPPPDDRPYWVIDPLDGTTNFVHGYPMIAVSIALVVEKTVQAGVIYQPLNRELFIAVRGGGTSLNGNKVHVSQATDLSTCLLTSGFPYDAWENPDNNTREWAAMLKRVVSLRSSGSAALDLCFVACGRLDGYWELDLEPWDMAAGSLIVTEAGGVISDRHGHPFNLFGRSIVASAPRIHEALLHVLALPFTSDQI